MLKINSLLNPASEHDRYGFGHAVTPPTTPADSAHAFSPALTSQPITPITPSPKRLKRVKDAANLQPGLIRGPINYPPFECNEPSVCLTDSQQRELEVQHRAFKLQPYGSDGEGGLISANVQHIPYSSDKRGFLDKTGRGGFDVFRYSFAVLIRNEKEKKWEERRFPVMWDYQVGLVRITPFFKACKYTKTIPNKSLTANAGLKNLSHSITGGSVEAQGYWVPYSCARALCLTFCYPIRWALTPIFGPSFIKECLSPDHPNFGRFKIDSEIVRISTMEQEGWRSDLASRDPTPANVQAVHEMPRSAPHHEQVHTGAQDDRPKFKRGSPFSDRCSDRDYVYSSPMMESPGLSPKSKHRPLLPVQSPMWTSINRSGYDSPLSSRFDSPALPSPDQLATKPGGFSPNVSWRDADARPVQLAAIPATIAPSTRLSTRRSIVEAPNYTPSSPVHSSYSANTDVQPPHKKSKTSKSKSASRKRKSCSSSTTLGAQNKSKKQHEPTEWTEEDMNVARWLLRLHDQPKEFTTAGQQGTKKRKADEK